MDQKTSRGAAGVAMVFCLVMLMPVELQAATHSDSSVRSTFDVAQSAASDWEKAAGGKMSFDVASVKESTSKYYARFPLDAGASYSPNGSLFLVEGCPLRLYIGFAYKLSPAQQQALETTLPRWANADRFDIQARTPEGMNPTKDQLRLMVRSLLNERFKLAAHMESKQIPVYALVLVKRGVTGSQLRPHSGPPCSSFPSLAERDAKGFPVPCGAFFVGEGNVDSLEGGGRNISIQYFASYISALPTTVTSLNRPLLDRTGLGGKFDIALEWAEEALPNATTSPVTSGPTLLEALQDQLGLKLKPALGSVDNLVIDHIEQPTPN